MREVTTIYYDKPFKVCPVSCEKSNWKFGVSDAGGFVIAICPTEHAAKFVCEKLNTEELISKDFSKYHIGAPRL